MVVDHDVGTRLRNQHFNDRAVARTQQHGLHTAQLIFGIALQPDLIEYGSDHMKAGSFAWPYIQHKQTHSLAGFGDQRLFHHAVVLAVKHGVCRLGCFQPFGVQNIERCTVDFVAGRIGFDIKLALNHKVFPVGMRRVTGLGFNHHSTIHA